MSTAQKMRLMVEAIEAEGYDVDLEYEFTQKEPFEDVVFGGCHHQEKYVRISKALSEKEKFPVLVHEYTHVLAPPEMRKYDPVVSFLDFDYRTNFYCEEYVARTVESIVARKLNLMSRTLRTTRKSWYKLGKPPRDVRQSLKPEIRRRLKLVEEVLGL